MDQSIFQLRNRLYQQIILIVGLIIGFPVLIDAQVGRWPVYRENQIVGYLHTETALPDCENCYTLDTLDILGQQVVVRLDVDLIGVANGMDRLAHNVEIYKERKLNKREFLLSFSNTISGDLYELYFRKDKNKSLYIHRKQWFYFNSYVRKEIAENDYSHFQCTRICCKIIDQKIENGFSFPDIFFSQPDDDNPQNCFDCPIEYSLDKCLEMKAKNKKIIWKHEE